MVIGSLLKTGEILNFKTILIVAFGIYDRMLFINH